MMTIEQCWNAILSLARDNNVRVIQMKLADGYDPDDDRLHPEPQIDWKARAEAAEREAKRCAEGWDSTAPKLKAAEAEFAVCRGRLIIAEDECAEVERLRTNNTTLTRIAKEAGLKWGAAESRLAAATELLGRLGDWADTYGQAIVPRGSQCDTFGDGVRSCKRQVKLILAAQSAASVERAFHDGSCVKCGFAPVGADHLCLDCQPAAPAPMPGPEAERIVNGLASFVGYDFGKVR